ncbi:MAG: nuclease-related domain-containing protein [Acidimicrobiales bacterium]
MEAKIIPLRYAGKCAQCGTALPARTKAWWDAIARTITCVGCADGAPTGSPEAITPPPEPEPRTLPERVSPPASGQAGASALKKYEQKHQRREAQIDERWGRFAGVVKFLSEDPRSTKAWKVGSEGEQRLAASLARRVGDRAVFLHDRKVPKTRGNIDHIAIAASGVWIIDAKKYKGLVERRDKGGWSKADYRLYVNRRDKTNLVHGLAWQVAAVRSALSGADVPVHAALCFIDAEWSLFKKPFQFDGYWVTWGQKLAEMIGAPGPLTDGDVHQVADRLATALPPVISTT